MGDSPRESVNVMEKNQKQEICETIIKNQQNYIENNGNGLGKNSVWQGVDWNKVVEGIIKNITPQLVAHEIGGVSPMNGPVDVVKSLLFLNEKDINSTIKDSIATAVCRDLETQVSLFDINELKSSLLYETYGVLNEKLIKDLSTKVKKELDTEFVNAINECSMLGGLFAKGTFDFNTDCSLISNSVEEKINDMRLQILSGGIMVRRETHRNDGNVLLCSWGVLNLLKAHLFNVTGDVNINDETFTGYAGTYMDNTKVYVFPHAKFDNYFTIGYVGTLKEDAGLFYCPYTLLTPYLLSSNISGEQALGMTKEEINNIDMDDFEVKFKTRMAIESNCSTSKEPQSNKYYRTVEVKNLVV